MDQKRIQKGNTFRRMKMKTVLRGKFIVVNVFFFSGFNAFIYFYCLIDCTHKVMNLFLLKTTQINPVRPL